MAKSDRDVLGGSIDSPVDLVLKRQEEFVRILSLMEQWLANEQKLFLGIFHEFYMVRYVGWLVSKGHGFTFEPENQACTVSFFPDPMRPFQVRDVDGRTSVILGEPRAGGNAIILTEDFDDLVALAMHFRPMA
jgi:hypothetical protein